MPTHQSQDWLELFNRDGFSILEEVVPFNQVAELLDASATWSVVGRQGVLDRQGETYGIRDLLWRSTEVRRLAESRPFMDLVTSVLGAGAFPVRGLFFDKTPETNWNLPWHQDLTIAVRSRREVHGFGPWTMKAGIQHVHAPANLLSRMLTIRLHLDDCTAASGPMRVLPGSHDFGKLSPSQMTRWSSLAGEIGRDCLVGAGGIVLMRPLLLHASSTATGRSHRRVIHIEYASEPLPEDLEWYSNEVEYQQS